MANFAQTELTAIAEEVAGKVLANITPQIEGLAEAIASRVIAQVEKVIESKLGGTA